MMWMIAPNVEAALNNSLTHGPVPSLSLLTDSKEEGGILIGKNTKGVVVVSETWDGQHVDLQQP